MQVKSLLLSLVLTLLLTGCAQATPTPATRSRPGPEAYVQFEKDLEDLRQQHKIPGLSAAIVQDQQLIWARGFGYADVENRVEAAPDTPYHLASVTKPFAAIIMMQLVEEGILDLEDPVAKYGVELDSQGVVRVKHLLSMTSGGDPGREYKYDGGRYARLGQIIETASGKSFQQLLFERILDPLAMTSTAPSPGACAQLEDSAACEEVYSRIARPYQLDPEQDSASGYYERHFSAAAGLISTAADLAKFDIALDEDALVSPETRDQMFAPTVSTTGAQLPYGLGWFSQEYGGTRLIWHYGYWSPSVSSLILKVPEEQITFIILANTDNLSRPYRLGDGDVLHSPAALAFYERFVFEPRTGQAVPDIDWAAEAEPEKRLREHAHGELRELLAQELASSQMLTESMRGVQELEGQIAVKLATDVKPQVYDAYVGRWQAPTELGAGVYPVVREDEALYLETPDGLRLELFPQSETEFFHMSVVGANDFELTFVKDELGQATQAVVQRDAQEFTFHRVLE
jgi:CubicO group peptidase (beta-lactamase class C family)